VTCLWAKLTLVHTKHVPLLGPRYWIALCMASVFGANMGDFFASSLHLGHLRGVPILAAALLAIVLIERRDDAAHEAYYWSAIVVIRTAATNLADLAMADLKLPWLTVMAGLAVLLAASAGSDQKTSDQNTSQARLPATTWSYWLCMLIAGTLGTVVGDFTSFQTGLGLAKSSIVLSLILAAVFYLGRGWLQVILFYWLIVVLVRAAGTAVGDFFASKAVGLGLPLSTALTGAVLVATLMLWKERSLRHSAAPTLP
jgi:uncharacterized membrane-anchored protein